MRVLLIKLSSMGDVLHALPAVSDAIAWNPGLKFDWLVEEAYAEIPAWHAGVERVWPAADREWRRRWWDSRSARSEFCRQLKAARYDLVLDAQGLLKSARYARLSSAPTAGFGFDSARETLAPWFYRRRVQVDTALHAVDRLRCLFAAALDYERPAGPPDFGIDQGRLPAAELPLEGDYVVLIHGTVWDSKRWPLAEWRALAERIGQCGLKIVIPSGDDAEHDRARAIARGLPGAYALSPLSLGRTAALLRGAHAAVAVDTGLGHLAAALGTPCVSIYGPTDPGLTGTVGANQAHARAQYECAPCLSRRCRLVASPDLPPPCYQSVPTDSVWNTLCGLAPL